MKTCTKCSAEKPLDKFYKSKTGPQGRSSECKECTNKRMKENYCPKKALAKSLKSKYNISLEQYDDMLSAQDYCCAICGTDSPGRHGRFVVDHNHETEEVRGLLCWSCNVGIGHLKDSPKVLASALTYLTTRGNYEKES